MAEEINKEDTTRKLGEEAREQMSDSQKLDWLSSQVDELKNTLQEFMARDTNRLPKDYDARFAALEKEVRHTNHKLDVLNTHILNMNATHLDLSSERVTALERLQNRCH